MAMISYAQNGEDVLLERVFAGQPDGFYIDVGANDPVLESVTKHFSERGWRGINVEPVPSLFARLQADRPRDVNLNVGLSDRDGTLTFYQKPGLESYSSSPELMVRFFGADRAELVEHQVPVTTLRQVCERHADRPIDFLKIDVDCHEGPVIAGGDWARWRPRVVLVEDLGVEGWEPLLLEVDYLYASSDGINRYYVRAEDRDLIPRLSPAANYTDDYIPYKYLRVIQDLEARLARYGELGPGALGVARRLHGLSARYPALARPLRWMLRSA